MIFPNNCEIYRMSLQSTFIELTGKYSSDKNLIQVLWKEVEKKYSSRKRYYHTLEHLDALLSELHQVKESINNWDVILFSLFYHDSIYNSLKPDNEEKSAELANKGLGELGVDERLITECKELILATKSHQRSTNEDFNYFTDADLSVLGQDWNVYSNYYKNVRREYSVYPDMIYNPGRIKVLKHFLRMERIYKTGYFYTKLESQARLNMAKEMEVLEKKQ